MVSEGQGLVKQGDKAGWLGSEGPLEEFVIDAQPTGCRLVGCGSEGSGDLVCRDGDEVSGGCGVGVIVVMGGDRGGIWWEETCGEGCRHVSRFG